MLRTIFFVTIFLTTSISHSFNNDEQYIILKSLKSNIERMLLLHEESRLTSTLGIVEKTDILFTTFLDILVVDSAFIKNKVLKPHIATKISQSNISPKPNSSLVITPEYLSSYIAKLISNNIYISDGEKLQIKQVGSNEEFMSLHRKILFRYKSGLKQVGNGNGSSLTFQPLSDIKICKQDKKSKI